MGLFFAQAPVEGVAIEWVGLLLTIGLCACPVAIIVVGILISVVIAKRRRKPPE